jgi:hypothetical protein
VPKSSSLHAMVGMMCCCSVAPVFPLSPAPRYADVTVHVHRYEGGAFVVEKLKDANARAGVSCKEVEDPGRGTVIKSDPGYFVVCGYAIETSRLPSKNIIEISSVANTTESEAAEDKIFREFIKAIKGNPEVEAWTALWVRSLTADANGDDQERRDSLVHQRRIELPPK